MNVMAWFLTPDEPKDDPSGTLLLLVVGAIVVAMVLLLVAVWQDRAVSRRHVRGFPVSPAKSHDGGRRRHADPVPGRHGGKPRSGDRM